jgi:hypothetical protein
MGPSTGWLRRLRRGVALAHIANHRRAHAEKIVIGDQAPGTIRLSKASGLRF